MKNQASQFYQHFHDKVPYHIETSPSICSAKFGYYNPLNAFMVFKSFTNTT